MVQLFLVAIHFHPDRPQPKTVSDSSIALVDGLLKKLVYYLQVSSDGNVAFNFSEYY